MRIVYLLEATEWTWGGVKSVLEHANGLVGLGHRVLVLSKGPAPTWFPLRPKFRRVQEFTSETIPPADYIIGTIVGAVYASAGAALVPHSTVLGLAGVLAVAIAPLAYAAAVSPIFPVAPVTAVLVLMISYTS